MLQLVSTNNAEVARHLASPAFQRLSVDHTLATSYEDALARIAEVTPQVVLIDDDLAGKSGFDLCRAVKEDPALGAPFVIMLLGSAATAETLERIEHSGCDDVIALPVQVDEFYHHIAQLVGLPVRRRHRVGVRLELLLPDQRKPVVGTVLNISTTGLGCEVKAPLQDQMKLRFRLNFEGTVTPETPAVVSWIEPAQTPGQPMTAGLALGDDTPIKTRMLLENLALFDVTPAPEDSPMAGGVAVALQGDFNELTKFDALAEQLRDASAIDFNASAIRYMSSAGVRAWCRFVDTLAGKRYVFRHCSTAFVSQASMVPMVIGSGQVLSLEAPYMCESCDREETRLLEVGALARQGDAMVPPTLTCHACGDPLEFDDLPARYFAFLTG